MEIIEINEFDAFAAAAAAFSVQTLKFALVCSCCVGSEHLRLSLQQVCFALLALSKWTTHNCARASRENVRCCEHSDLSAAVEILAHSFLFLFLSLAFLSLFLSASHTKVRELWASVRFGSSSESMKHSERLEKKKKQQRTKANTRFCSLQQQQQQRWARSLIRARPQNSLAFVIVCESSSSTVRSLNSIQLNSQ